MTRTVDDVNPDAWKRAPPAAPPQQSVVQVVAPLPPSQARAHVQHPPLPRPSAPASPARGSLHPHVRRHAPAQRTRSWSLTVSSDGSLSIACNASLVPFADAVFDARLRRRLRRVLPSILNSLDSIPKPHDDDPDPITTVRNIPDQADVLTSTDISRDSSLSPSSNQWRSAHPANSLKRRRSAVSPQSLPIDFDDDLQASDATSSEAPPPPPQASTSFRLNDEEKVTKFLADRFSDLQQATCKIILKDWIKRIEPKKQSKFPYSASNPDRQAPRGQKTGPTGQPLVPPWWPKDLRHKEPDHIDKEERRQLFLHLLELPKNPNYASLLDANVQREVLKRGWINILEESTKDKTLLIDREKDNGIKLARRKKILEDIYYCAKSREEVWMGGRDMDEMISFIDPIPLSRGRYPKKERNARPDPSKANGSRPESKSKAAAEASEDASDDKEDESDWDLPSKDADAGIRPQNPLASKSYSVSGEYPPLSASTVTFAKGPEQRFDIRRQSLSDLPANPFPMDASHNQQRHLTNLQMARTASSISIKSSPSEQAGADLGSSRHRRQYQASNAKPAVSQGNLNSQMTYQQRPLESPPSSHDQSAGPAGADGSVSGDSDNFTLHSARARQQHRQLSTAASQTQHQPLSLPNATGTSVDQLSLYSPSHTSILEVKNQHIDISTSEPPYDMKRVAMAVQSGGPDNHTRYGIFPSESQQCFGFTQEHNQYHDEATGDLSNGQPLHVGQHYESEADYAHSMYEDHRQVANADYSAQISTAEYSNYTNAFAQPLSLQYSTTAGNNPFQSTPFVARNDYSPFQSSPDVTSPPTSIYTRTPSSSTMGQSPVSATSSYHHQPSISRSLSTIPQYQDTGSSFPMDDQTMRKSSNAISLQSSGIPQSFAPNVHGLSMDKVNSNYPQDTNDVSFRNGYIAPPYMDESSYEQRQQYL